MESFPSQSPETTIDDDDDDQPDSSRNRKSSRDEAPAAVAEKEENREKQDSFKTEEVEKPKNEEGDIPLESLADDEQRLVAQQYIDERAEALKTELVNVPENSPDEAAALANATMLEAIEAKLSRGETPEEQTIEDALSETAQELDIEVPEIAAELPQKDENADAVSLEASEDAEEQPDPPDPATAASVAAYSGSSSGSNSPTNPVINIPAPGPGPVPGSPNNIGVGNNNLPPLNRVRGYGGVPPFIPNYNVNNTAANPNNSPPNAPNAPEHVIIKHNAAAPYLLLGYLIGRRRGRIKTEEKLLPVQKKLEKEVSDLHKNIAAGEEKIRKLAREKAEATPGAAAKMAERLEERKKTKTEKTERTEIATTDTEVKIKPEKLGMLAVSKESPSEASEAPKIEKENPKTPEPLKVPEKPKDPAIMNIAELLLIAIHIPAENGNVKKLFEKQLITEKGLREITMAYLKGERYDSVLKDNRISVESQGNKNYETSPSINHPDSSKSSTNSSTDTWTQTDRPPVVNQSASQSSTNAGDSSQPSIKQPAPPKSLVTISAFVSAAVLAAIVLLLVLLRR